MANQPTAFTGYWAATALAPFLNRPIVGSYLVGPSTLPLQLDGFQEMIDERSAEFDQAAFKAGYGVPIPSTATGPFLVAKRVVRLGAVADALAMVYTGPDPKSIDRFQTAFDNALKLIAAGTMPIPGAPDSGSAGPEPIWSGISSAMFNASMGAAQTGLPNDF